MSLSNTTSLDDASEAQLEERLNAVRAKRLQDRTAYKELSASSVRPVLAELKALSAAISNVKQFVYQRAEDLVKLKKDAFGVTEFQKSHSFSDETGGYTIGFREVEGWDDTVGAGIEKIHEFLSSLSTDFEGKEDKKASALIKLIFDLLRKDRKGNLRSSAVVQLKNLEETLSSEEFSGYDIMQYRDGVRIISNAFSPQKTRLFIEAWTVDALGQRVAIPLSIVSADFPEGYEFGGF